jgi:putative oxidoreductase
MNKYLNPLSRTLVAAIFLLSGLGKIAGFHETVAMAGSAGLPLPALSIAIAALVEIGGGLALLSGWQVRWASAALIAFLIPVTVLFHAAHMGDAAQGRMQMIEALKNLAIIGGLLKFYVDASGEGAGDMASPEVETLDFRARRAS